MTDEVVRPDFSDRDSLIECTRCFVHERIGSLQGDVDRCLENQAPFPALLYCFSIVDLLGALVAGNAESNAPTSQRAKAYMTDFMRYTEDQVRLLQKQFRHKIVHLALPKPIIEDQPRLVAWTIYHDEKDKHLKLETAPPGARMEVGSPGGPKWEIPYTHVFNVSVLTFATDIKDSATGIEGYLNALQGEASLQDNARKVLTEIFEP